MASLSSIRRLADKLRDFSPCELVAEGEGCGEIAAELSGMFRRLQDQVHIVVMTYAFAEDMLKNNVQWIEDKFLTLTGTEGKRIDLVPIFLIGSASRQVVSYVHRELSRLHFLEGQPIVKADPIIEKRGNTDLRKIFLRETDYRLLSPYRIDELVGSKMFFGREAELAELKNERANLVLIGSRRIGKSSLVARLQESMGFIRLPAVGFKYPSRKIPRCVYLDVSTIAPASKSIWDAILKKFNIERRDLAGGGWRADLLGKRPRGDGLDSFDEAKAVQSLINRFEGKLTIILDEVDSWIHEESDQLWPCLDKLRSFTDNGRARVILVGYESLSIAARYHKFPLTSRGQLRLLGALDFEAVKRLTIEPLEELEIGIERRSEEQILNRIWKTTSGFPHLVQDICANIVKLTREDRTHNRRSAVTMALTESAISQSGALKLFIDRIVDKDFPLARAIAAICSTSEDTPLASKEASGTRVFTISEISRQLESSDAGFVYNDSDFDLALTALELRSVLRPANSQRTRWLWVNEPARQNMETNIKDTGYSRFIQDLVHQHQVGRWRESFKKLHWI